MAWKWLNIIKTEGKAIYSSYNNVDIDYEIQIDILLLLKYFNVGLLYSDLYVTSLLHRHVNTADDTWLLYSFS